MLPLLPTQSHKYQPTGQAELPYPEPPQAIEGYDKVLAMEEVLVVYIPLPTALRKEWVLKAAAAGKVIHSLVWAVGAGGSRWPASCRMLRAAYTINRNST